MGLLDQVIGAVAGQMGGQQGTDNNPLMQLVLQLVRNHPGGLQGLVTQLTQGGLGSQVQSWVGTGDNLPVSGDDLMKALGGAGGSLGHMLSQFGLDPQQAAGGLAQALPDVVNQLTPNGRIEADSVEAGLSGLLDRFR